MDRKSITRIFNIDRTIALGLFSVFISVFLALKDNSYIIIFLIIIVVVVYSLYHRKKKYHSKPISKYSRFEDLLKEDITYSFIDYEPFFKMEGDKGIGIGGTLLLNKIFDKNLYKGQLDFLKKQGTEEPQYHNWHTIFDKLANKKLFDIIATPMYETRSRLYDYNISYCTPLFYSTIGLYVKSNSIDEDKNNDDIINELKLKKDLSFTQAKKIIERKIKVDGWIPEYLDGEISHLMIKKHFKISKVKKLLKNNTERKYSETDFYNKLKNVASGKLKCGNFIFMEVFKAEHIKKKHKLDVVNILQKNTLIYPVSFVVRKEDTVLRNFINLRLAELAENGELLTILQKEADKYDIKIEEFDDKFIQTYDFSLIDTNYHKQLFSERIKQEYDILEKVYGNYKSFQNNILNEINNFSSNKEELKVLEIGCGTGWTSNIILQSNKKIDLILLDNDPDMISIANKHIKNPQKHTFNFVTSDIVDFLNSNKMKFDIIVSAYTIHNFHKEYRSKLYSLIYKALNNNGQFINADKYAPDDDDNRMKGLKYRINKFTDYLLNIKDNEKYKKKVQFEVIYEWISHYIDDQSPNKVMKENVSKQELTNIGFKGIKFVHSEGDLEMMKILIATKS